MAERILHVNVWVQECSGRTFLQLQWHDPHTGTRRTRSTLTADPGEAEKERADLEYELNHGMYGVDSKLSWERFRELFEGEYATHLRQSSREKLAAVFDVFEQLAKPRLLRSVNERLLSQFVKSLRERRRPNGKIGLAPITIRNYLVALKTAIGWAVGQKLLNAVPTFPEIKVPKKKPQPVPTEAFERLLDAAPDDPVAGVPDVRLVGRAATVGSPTPALGAVRRTALAGPDQQPRGPAGRIRQECTGPVRAAAPAATGSPGSPGPGRSPRVPVPVDLHEGSTVPEGYHVQDSRQACGCRCTSFAKVSAAAWPNNSARATPPSCTN
jgi:hypothetical protein